MGLPKNGRHPKITAKRLFFHIVLIFRSRQEVARSISNNIDIILAKKYVVVVALLLFLVRQVFLSV